LQIHQSIKEEKRQAFLSLFTTRSVELLVCDSHGEKKKNQTVNESIQNRVYGKQLKHDYCMLETIEPWNILLF